MSEFKAQILSILIVIGIFGILYAGYKTLIKNTWNSISNEVSEIISSTRE